MDGDNTTPSHLTTGIKHLIEETGPANDIDTDSQYCPFDYLLLFVSETFFENLAEETNSCAITEILEKPNLS
uniref:Uncharacterized protein n=1 Tax=Arion vulgaris TaxID=1028688 RepID=A0A0B6Y131_9EUPU